MYPRPTEGGGEALVLLEVGQGVVVELHGLAGKPPAELVDALLHPAGRSFLLEGAGSRAVSLLSADLALPL